MPHQAQTEPEATEERLASDHCAQPMAAAEVLGEQGVTGAPAVVMDHIAEHRTAGAMEGTQHRAEEPAKGQQPLTYWAASMPGVAAEDQEPAARQILPQAKVKIPGQAAAVVTAAAVVEV